MTEATVTIELVDEPRWADGPIRISVSIANPGPEPMQVSVGYPIPSGLTVTVLGGAARARPVTGDNVKFIPLQVAPGQAVTLTHELRRYLEVDAAGAHRVRVGFAAHATRGGKGLELTASRELSITLAPPDAPALAARIQALLAEARTGAPPDRAAAVESLSWLRSPAVVPALAALASTPEAARPALTALASIDTPEALAAVAAALPGADFPTLTTALGALGAARRALPPAAVRTLLGGPAPVQQATLSYLADTRVPGFVADAKPLVASANPAVAAAAQRYLATVP